ncbi:MAG: hypothetical protein ABWZ25_17360 [Chitinophagaceae bacterium]
MEYLLFVAYLIFFAWLVTRTKFFLASGLSKPQLVILFLLKIIAGIFYGWIGIYYGELAQMSDTWSYHSQGLVEYNILRTHPPEYFSNLFNNPYEHGLKNFFGSQFSYWNDLKSNVFIKFISIFDIFSGGYYYVNVIFYTYATFVGPIALFRVMNNLLPGRRIWVVLGVFFIPSFFYWGSGLHKEGLISMGISLIMYAIYFSNKQGRLNLQRFLLFMGGLLLLLILRNFVLMLIIPAIIAWILSNRKPVWTPYIYSGVYVICILLFFTSRYLIPDLDFPAAVVEKQQSFLRLVGNSSIPFNVMQPDFGSFIASTPKAFAMAATRPYPSDISHLLSLAAAVEIGILLLLVVIFLLYRIPKPTASRTTLYFCFFFSLTMLLAIGFSVNNLGAIARYRSIVLPLIMTPLLARTDWNRFVRLFAALKT